MSLYTRLTERFPLLAHLPVRELKNHWLTVSFFVGFIVDSFTLNRVDQLFDNLVLATYVLLAMGSMLALYAALAGRVPERLEEPLRRYAPLATQYAFGGLLSGMLIFYGRSGDLLSSWPYLLIIIGVIVGNETLTKRGDRLVFNLVIFFIGLFSYLVLVVPVFLGAMGAWLFVLSGVLALAVFAGYLRLLKFVIPNFLRANQRLLIFSIGLAYMLLNVLYFTNVIPPIPLSLKELGVYHAVERVESGDYALTYEKGAWYEFLKNSDDIVHYQPGDVVYCFAAVFAPTRLATEIFHRWEYYVPEDKEWRTHGRFSYAIAGGRDGGFRGFTSIQNVRAGEWRCTVETTRKQILGRETFTIEEGAPERGLVTELR